MFRRPRAVTAMYLTPDGTEADATQHPAFQDAQQDAASAINGDDEAKREDIIRSALLLATKLGPDLYVLCEMAELHWKGVRKLSATDVFVLFCCLAYIANPLDAIPDAVPGIGLSDDLAVLAMAVQQLKGQISDFRVWKENNLDLYRHGKEEVQCSRPACTIL